MDKFTYTPGFKFIVTKDFTRRDYINLCSDLELNLSIKYNELINVKPEPIAEGGIRIYHGDGYKSIRHRLHSPYYNKSVLSWPNIGEHVVEEWSENDKIIFPERSESKTFLKAFDSPLWTKEDLTLIGDCMNRKGIYTYDFPNSFDLISEYN